MEGRGVEAPRNAVPDRSTIRRARCVEVRQSPAVPGEHEPAPVISFRPLLVADLLLVAEWLAQDHVRRWWPEPQGLAAVREEYLPRIAGSHSTEMFVAQWNGDDVGLIQRYRIYAHPDWAEALRAAGVDAVAAAGIDYFVGEPTVVGRGVGSKMIGAFSRLVLVQMPDVDSIVVTPQAANGASCRVLEKNDYVLVWTGKLASDDPSDAGPSALFVRRR